MQALLDSIRAYAAVYRFLNTVLYDEYQRLRDLEPFWFISGNGELRAHDAGFWSSDPAYVEGDWRNATLDAEQLGPADAYDGLLRFADAYAERGADPELRAVFNRLRQRTDDGLPADTGLRDLFARAWTEATNAESASAIVEMTASPFFEHPSP